MMHKCAHPKYDGNSNSQSHLANIAVDVVMPPLNYREKKKEKKKSVQRITSKLKGKNEFSSTESSNIIEQTQGKVELNNNFVKSRRTESTLVLKELCEKIKFDEAVVEERSPQSVPFSQYNSDKMYKTKIFKNNNNNLQGRVTHVKAPLNLKALKKVKKASSETFFLGCSDSLQTLKPSSPKRRSKSLVSISKDFVDDDHTSAAQTWEEYVLSRLSNATADILLRGDDPSPQYTTSQYSTRISDMSINESSKEEKTTDPAQTKCTVKADSAESYFENVPHKRDKSKREKNIQDAFPCSPSRWLECDQYKNEKNKMGRVTRGMQKWVKYPTFKEGKQLVLHQVSETDLCGMPPVNPVENKYRRRQHGFTLLPVVNEWRDKWVMDRQSFESSFAGLMSGMVDVCERIRYAAVSAIGSVITEQNLTIDEEEILVNKTEHLMDDNSSNVSLAAAVSLFCMNKATTKATDILMKTVQEGDPSERWVAVQCLAEYLYHDNCIIKELISNVMSDDAQKHKVCMYMLKKISHLSMSIQYMVAEKLNSGSWRDRVVSCHVLPNLEGTLSNDIANKLSYLLWHDWNADVRKAAAEALGKTGNGKLVHSILREKLQSNNRKKQISALKKIASLGIMTVHLLSPLILCLDSDDDEVCLQTIKICMKMKLNDENILNGLVKILNSDRACKVRRYALRGLGCVGHKSELIRDSLLWTVHFNKEPVLRREACSTLVKLGFQDEDIINVLQDIVFIDKDALVRQEVVIALCSMGVEAVGNINLIETIQKNVKELCSKEKVIAQVVDGKGDIFHQALILDNAHAESSEDSHSGDDVPDSDADIRDLRQIIKTKTE